VLGSHNSYHQAPSSDVLEALGGLATAGPLQAWQYTHAPLARQLDAGVRALELDVYWDPEGGRFAQVGSRGGGEGRGGRGMPA
jgi:hypothetical protein